ncbi:MAG: hypothetical protein KDA85_21675, partial [Planctomycetaceae bacterium]|nr:hypothetical protein [Planctomycetaceae bacterium]
MQQLPAAVVITDGLNSGVDQTPIITWQSVPDATNFELWISVRGQAAPLYHRNNQIQTSHSVESPLGNGDFTVWVRAHLRSGTSTAWGTGFRMSIGVPVTPKYDGQSITWPVVAGATQYEIWVDFLLGLQLIARSRYIHPSEVFANSWTIPIGSPAGEYRIWVRALRLEGDSTYRAQWGGFVSVVVAQEKKARPFASPII